MLVSTQNLVGGNNFVEILRAYISDTLHQPVDLRGWDGVSHLPTFLSQRYELLSGEIARQSCLLAVDKHIIAAKPAEIAKHFARIERAFNGLVIYAGQQLSADRRSRLIANGVPFVIPGNQLYIPQIALDLREHFRARPKRSPEQLSPVAQAVLFHHLLRRNDGATTPSRLAKVLYYSAMSVGRAFDELRRLNLAEIKKDGRTKKIEFTAAPRSLIETARPFLRNPARGHRYIRGGNILPHMIQGGESALSALTDLSPPLIPVHAVHYKRWDVTSLASEVAVVNHVDEATSVIELWYYNPNILSDTGIVDRLSLYAEFWDHKDERIAKAAEDLLGQISW